MAATGYTPIYLYHSSTTSNTPSAGNLGYGELAINITDKNLFFKDNTNAVNTVPIRQASGSSNGWLSSTDWTTFNNKGSGTVTSVAALTLGTTGTDLSSTVANGTTTPVITLNVPTASASNRGALSSTDWSTFNGKQAALVSGTNIKTVSGTTLLGSGDLGTIGTGYGGTGLTGFTAANNAIYSTSSSALTAGTLPIAAGGTAQTSFNSGRIHYGSFSTSANLTTDGTDLTLGAGNLVIGTSGKGIDFSATAGTGTSELLADYEEGTWTPSMYIGSVNTGITYSTQAGNYIKIGNVVTVHMSLELSSKGGLTGGVAISGLPFTSKNVIQYLPSTFTTGLVTVTSVGMYTYNNTTLSFQNSQWNYSAALDGSNISNTSRFELVFSYLT